MLQLALFLAALATLSVSVNARVFSLCELVRELRRQGYHEPKLPDWACLVKHESGMNTSFVGHPHADGSKDFGLFQINDELWCNNGEKPGKGCNITCKQVLTDDITVAAKCAKEIFNREGFRAWHGWRKNCRTPDALPIIHGC